MDDDEDDRFWWFQELFDHELESWFTASIACCDDCCDEFLSVWPYADVADDFQFQKQAIPLDVFYSGSRLRESFTKEEFDVFVERLACPRCGSALRGNIWPYELPFDFPADIEETIREVAETAGSTPFLLLEHEFCQRILGAIRDLRGSVAPSAFAASLFRARRISSEGVAEAISEFDFPPKEVVSEGRYNHSGDPVLYLASDVETCRAELRGERCIVLELRMRPLVRILDLVDPFAVHDKHADVLNCLVYSALISSKQDGRGAHRPHYVVSRFVADCARSAGFDAIRYPSTRLSATNFNLVIVNRSLCLSGNADVVAFHRYDT